MSLEEQCTDLNCVHHQADFSGQQLASDAEQKHGQTIRIITRDWVAMVEQEDENESVSVQVTTPSGVPPLSWNDCTCAHAPG